MECMHGESLSALIDTLVNYCEIVELTRSAAAAAVDWACGTMFCRAAIGDRMLLPLVIACELKCRGLAARSSSVRGVLAPNFARRSTSLKALHMTAPGR